MSAVAMKEQAQEGAQVANARAIILRVNEVSVRFGGVNALNDVGFTLDAGSTSAIIGPNGAGKTTFFNCLSRLVDLRSGAIHFDNKDLALFKPWQMAGLGIGRTFQNLALFGSLTVIENIMLGAHGHARSGVIGNSLATYHARCEEKAMRSQAWNYAEMVGLESVGDRTVSDLPFGFQKRVELARALACRPRLLLLDEPAAGLIHEEVDALGALIRRVQKTLGLTVLMVEHHMGFTMGLCEKIIVLNFGRKIADGSPTEVQGNADVIAAYLGSDA